MKAVSPAPAQITLTLIVASLPNSQGSGPREACKLQVSGEKCPQPTEASGKLRSEGEGSLGVEKPTFPQNLLGQECQLSTSEHRLVWATTAPWNPQLNGRQEPPRCLPSPRSQTRPRVGGDGVTLGRLTCAEWRGLLPPGGSLLAELLRPLERLGFYKGEGRTGTST